MADEYRVAMTVRLHTVYYKIIMMRGAEVFASLMASQEELILSFADNKMSHAVCNILIADDDPVVRHILTMILEGLGHSVETVSSGEACVTYIASHASESNLPSLVFLDNLLPDITGLEVLSRLRQITDKVPVVMLSASSEAEILDSVTDQMPNVFLEKPFTPSAVAKVLDTLLR
jgi:CheY-like chemotaxis protein